MKPSTFSWSFGAAALLLTLTGCGEGSERKEPRDEPVFRINVEGGGEESFPEFFTELTGADPVALITCSKDPTPQVADDEQTLCLRLHLDPEGLREAGAPATLPIQGEARLSDPHSSSPATFTAAPGHSPVVSTVWATVGCYSLRRSEPLAQQLEGRLELEENTPERLAGHVVLTARGEMRLADCRPYTSADFDFHFDVALR